jgi:hypothetical protein
MVQSPGFQKTGAFPNKLSVTGVITNENQQLHIHSRSKRVAHSGALSLRECKDPSLNTSATWWLDGFMDQQGFSLCTPYSERRTPINREYASTFFYQLNQAKREYPSQNIFNFDETLTDGSRSESPSTLAGRSSNPCVEIDGSVQFI